MTTVETQKYTIVGLVDMFDEQNNIIGQYPVGSVQELPVEFGNKEVELGRAELYVEDAAGDEVPEADMNLEEDEEIDASGEEDEDNDEDEDGDEEVE